MSESPGNCIFLFDKIVRFDVLTAITTSPKTPLWKKRIVLSDGFALLWHSLG